MWRRLRRKPSSESSNGSGTVAAVVERPVIERPTEVTDDFAGTDEELLAEIDRLTRAISPSSGSDDFRHLLRLRHLAGVRALIAGDDDPIYPSPAEDRLPDTGRLPEIDAADLTPELMRAGILRDGCVLVRGLVDREVAEGFAEAMDAAYEERERVLGGADGDPGLYEEFEGHPPYGIAHGARGWVREGGGLLAADSPRLGIRMIEMYRDAEIQGLVEGYLGERPLITLEKTTLRKVEPLTPGAWHQDGAFMGPVRALNLWLSLCRCGDESPGLDLVPRRLNELVSAGTDGAILDYAVSDGNAEQAAGKTGIVRPIFEPGDAVFFDELCLHQTGSDPEMPNARYAIESWFFGGSAFPGEYSPVAV